MQFVPIQFLEYRFDNEGNVESIGVTYQFYDNDESLTARVTLTPDEVKAFDDKLTLDKLDKNEIDNLAREKAISWLKAKKEGN